MEGLLVYLNIDKFIVQWESDYEPTVTAMLSERLNSMYIYTLEFSET